MNSSDFGNMHIPPNELRYVRTLYKRSTVDYSVHFMLLYTTYSAWYQRALNTTNDREAIGHLKKRFIIWDDYINGRTMPGLRVYLERLADLTQAEPFSGNRQYWHGELADKRDWRALIEYWYQVRCLLVHGSHVQPKYVWLAYETLDIFMLEIIERMQRLASAQDNEVKVFGSKQLTSSQKAVRVRALMHARYITSPDIWQVDMQRVTIN